VEEKGFDTAIAAARTARVPLVVAGEGPDEARLRTLAAGADEVRFTGRLGAGELAQVRSRAAVVLVPSRWEEPCPYAALDALAAGVPVLASRLGGLPELVGEGDALPADDDNAWAQALETLWRDPAARREQGERGLSRARERFGADRYYKDLMTAFSW
jgi:glycosyltransferase involved in cell wall biosynthesis